jgi:predicted nucleic acid-binding protein
MNVLPMASASSGGCVSRPRSAKRFLIDSCLLIDHLIGSASARDFLEKHLRRCVLSPIAISEVGTGPGSTKQVSTSEEQLLALLKSFPCTRIDRKVAETAACFRRQKRNLPIADALQLATAHCRGLILATADKKLIKAAKHFHVLYMSYRP